MKPGTRKVAGAGAATGAMVNQLVQTGPRMPDSDVEWASFGLNAFIALVSLIAGFWNKE